jgi:branched-chain amino acid transport system permease protein
VRLAREAAGAAVLAAAAIAGLVYLPLVLSSYYLGVLTQIFLWAVFALSLDLIWGWTGMASFGHAAFWGSGAYVLAYLALHSITNGWVLVLSAAGVAALFALVAGLLTLRLGGIYFLMLTLAFAQFLGAVAEGWTSVTGGADGLNGLPSLQFPLGFTTITVSSPEHIFRAAGLFCVSAMGIVRVLTGSTTGLVLLGIKGNEVRMRTLGFDTVRVKLGIYIFSAVLAGIAGALYAVFQTSVSPDVLSWIVSGDVVIMVLLGGTGTVLGPPIGAAVLLLLNTMARAITFHWQAIIGCAFIVFVLWAPRGLVGLVVRRD